MPQIEVVRPFTLTLESGQKFYPVGKYDVSDEVANHPYTKHHIREGNELEGGYIPPVKHPHEGQTSPFVGASGVLLPEKMVEEQAAHTYGSEAVPGEEETGKLEKYTSSSSSSRSKKVSEL